MSILVYGRDVFCHLCYLPYTSTTWQTILKTLTLFFRLVMRKYVVCYNNNADDIVLLAETIYKCYLTYYMTGAVLMI